MAKNDTVVETTPVDPTIAALLQEENTALKTQVTVLQDGISEMKVQITELEEMAETYRAQAEALESALIEKDAALEIAPKSEDGKGSVKIDTTKKVAPSVPAETFTVEGKKYCFKKAQFMIGPVKHTAQEALQNDALLVQLIDYPSVVEEV
jgi:predicted ribosome quality control (RQC) complex YloA/Tae2 family protein